MYTPLVDLSRLISLCFELMGSASFIYHGLVGWSGFMHFMLSLMVYEHTYSHIAIGSVYYLFISYKDFLFWFYWVGFGFILVSFERLSCWMSIRLRPVHYCCISNHKHTYYDSY